MFTVPIIFAVFAAILIVLALINSLFIEPIAKHVRKKAAEEQERAAWIERQEQQRKAREKAAAAKAIAAKEAAVKKAIAQQRRNEREQKQAAAHAVKVARATELAELAERRLNAERERQALKAAAKPAAKVAAPAPVIAGSSSNAVIGNNMFRNEVVSFTGTIPGMTRKEAIAAVEANGGKAFETMPVSTTLLVVGNNPGNGKLDKADMWRTRKITAKQFNTMCNVRVMVN